MTNAVAIEELKILNKEKELINISFSIDNSTALIGESGSGKSLTLKSLLNLLPSTLKCHKRIASNFTLDSNNVGFIPQNPFTSLSPMTKIKNQFFCSNSKKQKLLELVDLDKKLLERFPKELSGGQLQRIVIAIALSNDIKLLLLDEPTTALDDISKTKILNLIENITKELNLLMLFVTHDIESIKNICENIVIMKEGKIIEMGKTNEVLKNPTNAYTKKLINSNFKNKNFRT
ncbi:MAG: ATP-binding cassette domain-containing protein [Sphaerochaetaceae bacterium]|nr:ATP-binding cassette domain-containing protein [Sphaerochaetaceae bacterium]